ncbi:aminoglycoside phosphotransferase family protein [Actinoplanes sp. NPDC051470]|uniref:aminoglycoside phosphotransferase family protein n=1 Tax=Actinoplanes sp. NPDC051470 TaxID=3157224 RepID=UPI00342F8C15
MIPTPDLTGPVRAAFGPGRRLTGLDRLAGGSHKGVYRLRLDDATTAIAYVWTDAENYWPATAHDNDDLDPFSPATGLRLFLAAHARLAALGLRVPALHLVEDDHLAIVEDFPGDNLQELLERDRATAEPIIARLAGDLARMRRHRAPAFGKIALVDAGGRSRAATCEAAALGFALRCLSEAAARDQRIADAEPRLAARLHELHGAVRSRAEFSVVHGELGLDHVMVDAAGRPALIDIEDLMYFDVEWEHVFLEIRLHDDYTLVAAEGLDEARLALYLLTQRLSLTAGPLRLLDGPFPDRDFMAAIAEHNLTEALTLI